jgi:hypothetical protein
MNNADEIARGIQRTTGNVVLRFTVVAIGQTDRFPIRNACSTPRPVRTRSKRSAWACQNAPTAEEKPRPSLVDAHRSAIVIGCNNESYTSSSACLSLILKPALSRPLPNFGFHVKPCALHL